MKDNNLFDDDVVIGSNPLPEDVQRRLGEFMDWLEANYEIKNGSTCLYWNLSYQISDFLDKKKTPPPLFASFDEISEETKQALKAIDDNIRNALMNSNKFFVD